MRQPPQRRLDGVRQGPSLPLTDSRSQTSGSAPRHPRRGRARRRATRQGCAHAWSLRGRRAAAGAGSPGCMRPATLRARAGPAERADGTPARAAMPVEHVFEPSARRGRGNPVGRPTRGQPVGWGHDGRRHRVPSGRDDRHPDRLGYGLATVTEDGQTLDTWYPEPALGEPPADAGPHACRSGCPRSRARTRSAACARPSSARSIDLDAPPADAADAYLRLHLLSHRLVAPARPQPRRHLRRARQRRVDRPRARARSRASSGPGCACGAAAAGAGVRRRQVPADDRLRGAVRGADRRRRPRAAGRAPGARDDGHARGVRQLQRRHARHLDDRGPGVGGRGRRRRVRRRRRARRSWARCPAAAPTSSRSAGGASSGRTRASASASATTASSRRAATSPRARRWPLPEDRFVKAARALRSVRPAVLAQLGHRRRRGPARGVTGRSSSTRPCTRTPEARP